ncbi:uncharacterized protein LOC62_02G002296 [Vanrija pseudolonga]|uniref:Uncharacterized protein n=1 Tax=Vanrija pseudolonga TaxID=143232 RepID=A0AAF0Y2E1_9TREE|nr:hypothetical protein LOC62_02G002296 [Vanrija pseudolonga]
MLLHSLIFALAATLAVSAPTPEPLADASADTSTVVDRNTCGVTIPVDLIARDASAPVEARDNAGFSVSCYNGPDCKGKPFYEWNDVIGKPSLSKIVRGTVYDFQHPANQLASCRVDVWNGYKGNFYMRADNERQISGKNYPQGWGQYCVNEWKDSFQGTGMVNKYVVVWRDAIA